MSVGSQIAPHLPSLRRFARALSGSQAIGDAFVAQTLEAIVADPAVLPQDLPVREGLYRTFLKLWGVGHNALRPLSAAGVGAVDRNLGMISPPARQAFLLRHVEGFSAEAVGLILDLEEKDCDALLDQAAREISEQIATDVLIIEDEAMIALDLEAMVEDLGHDVIGIADTHQEAIALMETKRPGLILADIQLADGSSGLDAVNEMLNTINVPVIFITAYPERLLTGEKPEPAFLITKPFRAEAVKAAVSQALFFDKRAGGRKAA